MKRRVPTTECEIKYKSAPPCMPSRAFSRAPNHIPSQPTLFRVHPVNRSWRPFLISYIHFLFYVLPFSILNNSKIFFAQASTLLYNYSGRP